jgi:hypothetical protein
MTKRKASWFFLYAFESSFSRLFDSQQKTLNAIINFHWNSDVSSTTETCSTFF